MAHMHGRAALDAFLAQPHIPRRLHQPVGRRRLKAFSAKKALPLPYFEPLDGTLLPHQCRKRVYLPGIRFRTNSGPVRSNEVELSEKRKRRIC